jgi:Cu/Ag efflux pump CusA
MAHIGMELLRKLRSIQKQLAEMVALAQYDSEFVFAVEELRSAQKEIQSAVYEVRCTLDDDALADYGIGCK